MVTSEEIIDNIIKVIGTKREDDVTPHVLSKKEMKDVLIYIVDLKSKLEKYEALASFKTELIDDVLEKLTSKDGINAKS